MAIAERAGRVVECTIQPGRITGRLRGPTVSQRSLFSDLIHDDSKNCTVRDMALSNHLRRYRPKCEQVVPEPFNPSHDRQLPLR